jgi:hypothetical protein
MTGGRDAMSPTYILIDFENVKPPAADLKLIRGSGYRVRLFHGPHQTKFDADIVKALQPLGTQVEFVQCERSGKNALDFHIAFYLGRMLPESEGAAAPGDRERFFIVSKDSGFDVLLDHVRQLGYDAARVVNIREALGMGEPADAVAVLKPTAKTPAARKPAAAKAQPETETAKPAPPLSGKAEKPDAWSRVIENLRDHPNNRPTTSKTLDRHIATLLGKETSPETVTELISRLQRGGIVVASGRKIEYKIPQKMK